MSLAYRCETCGGDPHWRLTRIGDVVTTWADDEHLPGILDRLQRDHEVTRIEVIDFRKAAEWAEIGRDLDRIANRPGSES